jgi:hypothetical protein
MFIAQDKRKKEILENWSLSVIYVSLHELSEDWIVAPLAAYPSLPREVFINTLMAEILFYACMSPVLASLECK